MMRVCCKKLNDEETGKSDGWITIGKSYLVLEVLFFGKKLEYRIVPDHGGTPPILSYELFEVIDGNLPPNWVVNGTNNSFELSPESWLRDGFWEDYFNDVEEAKKDFERETKIMVEFEAKSALVTDADLRQRALSREMKIRDDMSIMADNVQAALNRGRQECKQEGFQLGSGQGRIEGKLKLCLELYLEGTIDAETTKSKMLSLMGSGFDDLVEEYLKQVS